MPLLDFFIQLGVPMKTRLSIGLVFGRIELIDPTHTHTHTQTQQNIYLEIFTSPLIILVNHPSSLYVGFEPHVTNSFPMAIKKRKKLEHAIMRLHFKNHTDWWCEKNPIWKSVRVDWFRLTSSLSVRFAQLLSFYLSSYIYLLLFICFIRCPFRFLFYWTVAFS